MVQLSRFLIPSNSMELESELARVFDCLIMANPPQLPHLSNSTGLKTGLLMADVEKIIRTGGSGKAKANAKLDAAARICERQLDRLMERYKDSDVDFYGAYQVARIIVDAGGGPGTPPTPPATPKP
jgi:hypothetical protein